MAKAVGKVRKVNPREGARVAIALPTDLRKEVEEVCKALDMNLSDLMRNLLNGVVAGRVKLTRTAEVNDAVKEYYEQ